MSDLPRQHPLEARRPGMVAVWLDVWAAVRRRPLALLAVALVALDLVFIGIQIAVDATDYGFEGSYRLSLETEFGVAQAYGFAKALVAAALLARSAWLFRGTAAAFWSGALTVLALDDALGLHEKVGRALVDAFDLGGVGSLRAQDVGEMLIYALLLVAAIVLFLLAERRDWAPSPTVLSTLMIPPAALFVFCAVILDQLGVPIAVEDGGELLALSGFLLVALFWDRAVE